MQLVEGGLAERAMRLIQQENNDILSWQKCFKDDGSVGKSFLIKCHLLACTGCVLEYGCVRKWACIFWSLGVGCICVT